jgi:hypothetical protein
MKRSLDALAFAGLACVLAASGASCSDTVQADQGTDAYLQIPGAQFFRGAMPAGSKSGPAVAALTLMNNNIWPGLGNDPLGGALGATATAAAIGLRGDVGYWVVGSGPPSVAAPSYPTYSANLEFSRGIIAGSYTLVVRGVDASGSFGLPKTQILVEEDNPLDPPAVGDLVVTLTWDTQSSLDLHVVDPDGVEIYWDQQSSQPPLPNEQIDGGSYGYIDDDSNANCDIDGLRREDAIWPHPPPHGQYTVRVDAANLCGWPDANWKVVALLYGKQVAEATGVAVPADTWGSHGAGAGVLAFQFDVP